jgi:hypothetical protein
MLFIVCMCFVVVLVVGVLLGVFFRCRHYPPIARSDEVITAVVLE